jgi:glycosyltransferase involved in cell wall biosynthesis
VSDREEASGADDIGMKITFILPSAASAGGTRVVATYARLLHERGHDIHVISRAYTPPKGLKPFVRSLLRRKIYKKPTPTSLLDFLGSKHRILKGGRPLEAKDIPDADVVVATWWATAESVASLPPKKGRQFYLLQDYEVFPYLPVEQVIATYHLPLTKIAVSRYIKKEIENNHGIENIHVIPNAVDHGQFNAPVRDRNTNFTVGFLYTTTPRKNIALAIEIISLAKACLPSLQVKVFGTRPPEASLPLPSWVEYYVAPSQKEIPGIYAACDVWLFTSEKEGFGLPILESMACRTPVLATHAGAAPDLIDGTNGTLLPASAQAFANEIMRFAKMANSEWKGFSDMAYKTATSYSWEDATDRLLEVFASPNHETQSLPGTDCASP